ncbi:MAG TPA: LysM peptidoglycan-binding domain-containing protein [Sporosarcina sp.]|nr:LysM peptidoglycan-binding domain-containing protein [Sporosarcina sp.]
MDVHIVVKGDTLWKIARQYGIPFEDLKRVNAHLANPDYIVPGMKIFLPKKKTEHMPSGKGKEKMPEKVKQPQAPPQAHEKPGKPKEPMPLPKEKFEMPKPPIPSAPVQKPPAAMTPPAESPMQTLSTVPSLPPMPPPVPMPPMQMPPMQMPQFFQPCMPVPCGWMPIYDADCAPMTFPSFTQQMPAPVMPQQVMPTQEMPMPPAQLGVKPPEIDMTEELEEFEESPIYPGRGPGVSPPYPIRGWELMESPTEPMESPEQMDHFPPEQGYVPQMVSPEFQNPYGMMQQQPYAFGHPCMPMHHFGCGGCGCGCPPQGFYGVGPNEMQPNFMMPMQVSPMQMHPSQMYPMPMNQMPMNQMPMNQMPMNPMHVNPMQMQPFNPMDNFGCGC